MFAMCTQYDDYIIIFTMTLLPSLFLANADNASSILQIFMAIVNTCFTAFIQLCVFYLFFFL